jgi:hypothetical protein
VTRNQRVCKKLCHGCTTCQQNKPINNPTRITLQPLESAASRRPFAGISMDLITALPESNGYNAVLVMVDQGLSKGVVFIPCKDTIDAEQTANLLRQHVYKRFGLPDYIISDRGPQFGSQLSKSLARAL